MAAKGQRRRLPHAERRTELLAAAAAMFRERGYDATGIDAIAQAVGISGPAIYRYFSRKTEILIALIEASVADATATIDRTLEGSEDGDTLSRLAAALIDHAGKQGAVISLLRSGTAQMEASDRERLHRVRLELIAHLGATLCRARPDLTPQTARLHADAALSVIGHLPDGLMDDPVVQARFRDIVRAVLAA